MDSKNFSLHHNINQVQITDPFWTKVMELVRTQVIPYQYLALQDKIEGAEKSYCIENFIKAGKIAELIKNGEPVKKYPADKWCYDDNNADDNAFHGWVFQDSDVYKWLEAVAFSIANHPDKELEKQADEYIDIICNAQLENGYLDTLYIINDIDKCFSNLKDFHELYCFGHLAEAGVAYFNSTGKRKLLDACCRYADLICDTFGDGKIEGYPGHEIAEMALVKLYHTTGCKKYLETAKFFIDKRGSKPFYYDKETGRETDGSPYIYNQAHTQPRHQHKAVGHSVRGVYLYSAMADISREYLDEELYTSCCDIWNNIEQRKMYITGGIGATVDGEAFSFDYDLPNDLAYAETCASIGLIFFGRRMNEITPSANFGNVIERALYNTVLSGMALDGKSFFYVNPLEVLPEASHKDSRKRHVKPVRQKWFNCACCPPNLARLISSLNEYISSENENTIFVNQLIGCNISSNKGDIVVSSKLTQNGKININVHTDKTFTLAVRIPEYSKKFTVNYDYKITDGYAYFDISGDTELYFCFDISPKIIRCSNRVRENVGKVAITKGPFVYCAEEVDNGKDLQMLLIDPNTDFVIDGDNIIANGYRENADNCLYCVYTKVEKTPVNIRLIPYYKWANRGENEMTVYLRIDNEKI